ncbi:MAG TPA: hypothetical protein H9684_09825 [Firmicutes bacterium]|nr:hypothetical protein [Bacillota bacterium]
MDAYPIAPDYTWEIRINSFETGPDRRLRLSSQLKLQQEVGELHLSAGGLGYEELYRRGMAFVLTRTRSRILRAPVMGEAVRLRTWHRDSHGPRFYRCYQFLDGEGRSLIDSVTAFALVGVENHRLLRPTVFEQFGLREQPQRRGDCPDPAKWKLPDTLSPAGERRVRWSDIDCNGHLNNAVYADIACDALPGGMEGRQVLEYSIAFVHEATEGEALALRAGVGAEGEAFPHWVAGDLPDGRRCFEAQLFMAPAAVQKG